MIGGDENKKRILVIGDDLTFFQSEKAIFKIPEGGGYKFVPPAGNE